MSKLRVKELELDCLDWEIFINLFLVVGCLMDEVEVVCKGEGLIMVYYIVFWVVCFFEKDNDGGVFMWVIVDGFLIWVFDVICFVDCLKGEGYLKWFFF